MIIGASLGFVSSSNDDEISMQRLIASACVDVDATLAESYSGSGQHWQNLVPVPADGTLKSENDWFLGASATANSFDPTFTGSADDPGAYFLMDGGDLFLCEMPVSDADSAMLKAHRTSGGNDWWLALSFRTPPDDGTTDIFFTTQNTPSSSGITILQGATEGLVIRQYASGIGASDVAGTPTLTPDTNYLLIVSHSHADNETRYWLNSDTKVEVAHTFNASSTNSPYASIGSHSGTTSGITDNGTRVRAFSFGNEYIDDDKAALIIEEYETRHFMPPIEATGGTVTTDGAYTVHTFDSSGTFTVDAGSGDVEYLIVAGGGAGGGLVGGGGGGGGVLSGYGVPVEVGDYTITVGAGGAGAVDLSGASGENSSALGFTATGGGGGGKNGSVGLAGGSGGGGGTGGGAGTYAGGAGTVGQGDNGGSGLRGSSGNTAAGGGGGAAGAGSNGATADGGDGGNGVASSISGSSITYGGGGGGNTNGTKGSGGAGGGGNATTTTGAAGTANTGGGGGGGQSGYAGGAGGSGRVVIRYLT